MRRGDIARETRRSITLISDWEPGGRKITQASARVAALGQCARIQQAAQFSFEEYKKCIKHLENLIDRLNTQLDKALKEREESNDVLYKVYKGEFGVSDVVDHVTKHLEQI